MRTDPLIGKDVRVQRSAVALAWLCLLTATTALLLGTLPTLLVARWFGGAVSDPLAQWPWLAGINIYQGGTFAVSAVLLLMTAVAIRQASHHCPSHPDLARRARRLRHWNRWMLRVSTLFWTIGIFAAYAAMPLFAVLSS
jgi:hypothetical protein